ncbi:MAG: hypothetical protein WD794_10085 [Mycobacteriales bacterium]
MRIGSLLLVLWLVAGVAAVVQRGYLRSDVDCAQAGTVALTVVAGPLNYLGVNPEVDCPDVEVPQPST